MCDKEGALSEGGCVPCDANVVEVLGATKDGGGGVQGVFGAALVATIWGVGYE